MAGEADHTLDRLLDLDGVVLVVSSDGAYWAKFAVRRVAISASKPHGLDYSLTFHGRENSDAAELLATFWAEVDAVLRERGVV